MRPRVCESCRFQLSSVGTILHPTYGPSYDSKHQCIDPLPAPDCPQFPDRYFKEAMSAFLEDLPQNSDPMIVQMRAASLIKDLLTSGLSTDSEQVIAWVEEIRQSSEIAGEYCVYAAYTKMINRDQAGLDKFVQAGRNGKFYPQLHVLEFTLKVIDRGPFDLSYLEEVTGNLANPMNDQFACKIMIYLYYQCGEFHKAYNMILKYYSFLIAEDAVESFRICLLLAVIAKEMSSSTNDYLDKFKEYKSKAELLLRSKVPQSYRDHLSNCCDRSLDDTAFHTLHIDQEFLRQAKLLL